MIDSVVWAQFINVTDTQPYSHVALAIATLAHGIGRQKRTQKLTASWIRWDKHLNDVIVNNKTQLSASAAQIWCSLTTMAYLKHLAPSSSVHCYPPKASATELLDIIDKKWSPRTTTQYWNCRLTMNVVNSQRTWVSCQQNWGSSSSTWCRV